MKMPRRTVVLLLVSLAMLVVVCLNTIVLLAQVQTGPPATSMPDIRDAVSMTIGQNRPGP